MTNLYKDVTDFHLHYKLPYPEKPILLDRELHRFRVRFMKEELTEYITAWENGNIVKATDGLIDIVYTALGTACFMGVPFNSCWSPVQYANITGKYRSPNKRASKRGGIYDVLKKPDFVPPDDEIARILKAAGADI